MKTNILTSLLLLSITLIKAQDYNLHKNLNDPSSKLDNTFLKVGAGYWLPKGKLGDFIDNSPFFELAVVVPDSKRSRSFEIGVQLAVPEQRNFFVLRDNGTLYDIEATSIVTGYLKLNKYLYEKDKGRLVLGVSLGISSIFLDPLESEGSQALDYDSINSVLIAPGLLWDHLFNDNSMFQISIDVQYTPFKMERAVTRDLNSFNVLPKLSYRF